MYTYCTIRFIDDGSEMDVIIKAYDSIDDNDDDIFYYGLSRQDLIDLYNEEEIVDEEWIVINVDYTTDCLL